MKCLKCEYESIGRNCIQCDVDMHDLNQQVAIDKLIKERKKLTAKVIKLEAQLKDKCEIIAYESGGGKRENPKTVREDGEIDFYEV